MYKNKFPCARKFDNIDHIQKYRISPDHMDKSGNSENPGNSVKYKQRNI